MTAKEKLIINRQNRLGKTKANRNGQMMKIIEYIDASNLTIEFEDGTVVKGKRYGDFEKGKISNPNCMQPKTASTNELALLFYLEKYGFIKAPKRSLKSVGMGNFELDLYHPSLKVGIEYDGYRHTNKKDLRKNLVCKDALFTNAK